MDKYLDSFREMISLRGLTDRTINCAISQLRFLPGGKDPESPAEPRRNITLRNTEFIRRYLMHQSGITSHSGCRSGRGTNAYNR